ncbi:MAG TPA: Yip1 family protein [Gammaproteobacteria bacterium]|nr:Yip1 family protein [Gammaproteobacteria bacterium]
MSEDTHITSASATNGGDNLPSAAGIVQTVIAVITRPSEYFEAMPRNGGFVQPLIFMVVMGVAAGLVHAVLGLLGLLPGVSAAMALAAIVLAPILIAIFGFVGAAILFVIWKLMGSEQDFETAYRCTAYGSAISPVTQILSVIPYLGTVLGLAWWTFILVTASTRVHRIRQGVAAAVFGIIALLLAVASVGAEMAARRMQSVLEQETQQLRSGTANGQDAGQAMQDLGKMLQKLGKNAKQGDGK